jgi:beta-fructofuranosidase
MRADGWGGTYTLPREVEFKKGRLYQYPVREIYNYRQNKVEASGLKVSNGSARVDGVEGDKIELDVTFKPGDAKKAGVKFFVGTEHETLVYYDADLKAVVFDRAKSGITPEGVEPNLTVRYCDLDEATDRIRFQIFLDVCSAEIFINDGRFTMTGNMFPDEEDTGVVFFSEGECQFESIVKYDIVVEQTIG